MPDENNAGKDHGAYSGYADELHGEAAHAEIFAPFDPQFFPSSILWTIICFGIMYFYFSRFLLPRIGGVIEERSNRVREDLETARNNQQKASDAKDSFEKAQKDARSKAQSIIQAARDKADKEIAEKTAQLDDVLAAEQQKAADELKDVEKKANAAVQGIAEDLSQKIVNKISVV